MTDERADQVRDAALEEAAKVADGIQYPDLEAASDLEKFAYDIRCNIASAIRALASKPQASADVVEALWPTQADGEMLRAMLGWRCCDSREGLAGDASMMDRIYHVLYGHMRTRALASQPAPAGEGYNSAVRGQSLCSDCPPPDYPTDKTRCLPCPRKSAAPTAQKSGVG